MKLIQHTAASAAISAGVYAATGSWKMAAGCFLAGIFIDFDHLIDYWREHPLSTDIGHFFTTCDDYQLKKAYLYIHSLELALPFALLAWLTRCPWIIGFVIGWSQHMLFDYLGNKTGWKTYFFTHRLLVGFEIDRVFCVKPGGCCKQKA